MEDLKREYILEMPKDYEAIRDYIAPNKRALVRHKCGFIFKVRPEDIASGKKVCPKCKKKDKKASLNH